jgi:rare lipoprotein A
MSFPRPRIASSATALLLAATLLLPAAASATQGGVAAPDPTASFLNAGAGSYLGKSVVVHGRLDGTGTGDRVDVLGRRGTDPWKRLTTGTVKADGTFAATWKTGHIGRYDLRAARSGAATLAVSDTGTPGATTTTVVHRSSKATWFGPSDGGTETACGVTLTETVLGVANKTLPCGTEVSFYFHGKQLTVPVIDRGPYRAGVDWDLTQGAADALGFTDVGLGTVGAVALKDEPLADLSALQ